MSTRSAQDLQSGQGVRRSERRQMPSAKLRAYLEREQKSSWSNEENDGTDTSEIHVATSRASPHARVRLMSHVASNGTNTEERPKIDCERLDHRLSTLYARGIRKDQDQAGGIQAEASR